MRKCFGMKSKKQQRNQTQSTLTQESHFKHSKNNRSSKIKLPVLPGIISDAKSINPKRKSFDKNTTTTVPLHKEQHPLISEQREESASPVERQNHDNSELLQNKISVLNITSRLSPRSKLPPILSSGTSAQGSITNNPETLSPTRFTPGLCGLNNIGNTCFMNSAIQCLSSIPILTEWAMQQPPSLSCRNVIDVYISLVQAMWSGRHDRVTPRDLKTYVSHSAPMFTDYDQQDSHEFLNRLLNAIENIDSNSFIVDLFRINTESKIACQKHQHIDTINETTTFLSLPLPEVKPNDRASVLLEDIIQDFCQEDDLNGTYYCHQCNEYSPARQKTTIISPLPRVLIIQLKRFPFDNTSRKIDTLVQYKLEHENLLSNNDRYKLSAISLHSGSLDGGHYTTMARNYKTEKWYRFDDSRVEKIDSKHVLVPFTAQQAYVLIYLKQND